MRARRTPTTTRRTRWVTPSAASVLLVAACATTHLTPPLVDAVHRLPGPTVFTDVAVFDGESALLHLHQDVVVEGGVVARISSTGRPLPANATVVDGRGRTLMPALVDAHAHVTLSAAPPWALAVPDRAHNLESHLFAGVTTLVDLGGDLAETVETRALVDESALLGPRLLVAGPQVSPPSGYPGSMVSRLLPFPLGTLFVAFGEDGVATVDEARARVRERVTGGADLVKVALAETPRGTSVHDEARLAAIVDEAHRAAKKVVVHVDSPAHALRAARAGADALAHIPHTGALTDEDARLLARAGTVVIPTLIAFARLDALVARDVRFTMAERLSEPYTLLAAFSREHIDAHALDDELARWLDDVVARSVERRENVRRLVDAGVPILVGTDANGAPGVFPGAIHEEMRLLVEAGVPHVDVLRGATSRAARFFAGDEAPFGRVVVGQRADLLLVEGDPLTDIEATSRVVVLMQDGRRVVRIQDMR